MQHNDNPKFVEFKIHNSERVPSPYSEVKWGIPEVPTVVLHQSAMEDLNVLMSRTYQDMFSNMLRNDSIISARMKGYKRDREYGRRKWNFRVHSRAGRFLKKIGYWHLIDYIAFMWHTAKEAWTIDNYEYYRLSED